MTLLSNRPALWGVIALSGFLLSLPALLSLHFLRADYSPRDSFISEYAVGPYGYLMTAAFCLLGLSSLALASGLCAALDRASGQLCLLSLIPAALGLFVMALYRTDLNDLSPRTRIGSIHDSTSVVTFLAILGAMYLFAWKLSLPIGSSLLKLQSPSRLLTVACCLMLAIQLCLVGLQQGHRPYVWVGIPERVLVSLFLLWVSLLSYGLLSLPHTGKNG